MIHDVAYHSLLVQRRKALHFRVVADYDRALGCDARALAITAHRGDFALQVMTHEFLGILYHLQGNYRQAKDVLMKNVTPSKGSCAMNASVWQAFLP